MTTNEPPPYPGDQPDSNPSTSGLPSYGSVPPPQDGSYPPPPPPPGAPGGFEEPFSAPGAIAWGWRAFTANVGPILLAVLILAIIYVGFSVLDIVVQGGIDPEPGEGNPVLSLVLNLVSAVAGFFVSGAFIRATLDVADGEPFDLFGAFSRVPYGWLFLAILLTGLATILGLVALCIGAFVVAFLSYFTQYYVIDDRLGPWQAFTSSFRLVSANVGDSLLLALLNVLIIIGGLLLCGLGLIVAYPVTFLATAYAFRRFQGKPVASY